MIGVDTTKSGFRIHAVDAAGRVQVRRATQIIRAMLTE